MTEPSQDDRFDTREEEIQHYVDFSEGFGWSDGERLDFAKTVVRLKENRVDRDLDAPTA